MKTRSRYKNNNITITNIKNTIKNLLKRDNVLWKSYLLCTWYNSRYRDRMVVGITRML